MLLRHPPRMRRHEPGPFRAAWRQRQPRLAHVIPRSSRQAQLQRIVTLLGDPPEPEAGTVGQRVSADRALPPGVVPWDTDRQVLVRQLSCGHATSSPRISTRATATSRRSPPPAARCSSWASWATRSSASSSISRSSRATLARHTGMIRRRSGLIGGFEIRQDVPGTFQPVARRQIAVIKVGRQLCLFAAELAFGLSAGHGF